MKGSWGDFASYPVTLQGAATITSLLLLLYSQPHFCWSHPLPEQMGLLCLAKLHPENNSNRAQCPLAAGKNKPQMYFDAAAGATSPSLKNTTSCQSRKRDGWLRVTRCRVEERGVSFRIVPKWAIGGESAEWKIEVTLWKKTFLTLEEVILLYAAGRKKTQKPIPKAKPLCMCHWYFFWVSPWQSFNLLVNAEVSWGSSAFVQPGCSPAVCAERVHTDGCCFGKKPQVLSKIRWFCSCPS